jgi:phosphate:Na+ symporter
MLQRLTLPVVFVLLGYGFWLSPTFKEIAAGIAVFLFGMLCMDQGFRAFSGGALERLLRRSTDRTWKSLGFGIVTTTLMQSSSLVSVITIGFLGAGLLGLAQGIGIIFGANLGTTTGAWIVAGFGLKVNLSAYALPMLVFGVLMILQRQKAIKAGGWILVGFGFLFLGIHYMKTGFAGVADSLDLTEYAMTGVKGLLVYTAIGIAATVVMQSSHATLVLIITALGAGQVTYENALALAIGSNIGTTVTAVLGALGAPVEGRRLAGAHLLFNVGTGLIALAGIAWFVDAVEWISQRVGIAADDYTLKLAVFHTLFNLVGVAVFTPLIGRIVRLLQRVLRGARPLYDAPRYLSDAAAALPGTALIALRRETQHLLNNAFTLIAHGVNLRRSDIESERDLGRLIDAQGEIIEIDIDRQYELMIKEIYAANLLFYARGSEVMPADRIVAFQGLWRANLDIVAAIKATKHLRKNLVRYQRHPQRPIRREYNRMRVRIGELLRDIAPLRRELEDPISGLSLDALKVELLDARNYTNRVVDHLIRDAGVPAQVATSLMNDNAYVNDILQSLLSSAEAIVAASHTGDEPDLSLTAEEIGELADADGRDASKARSTPDDR